MDSSTSVAFAEKPNQHELHVAGVSFSFALSVLLLIQILVLFTVGSLGYLALMQHSQQLENIFQQRGKELVAGLSTGAANLKPTDRDAFAKLSGSYAEMTERQGKSQDALPVTEVFVLDKIGRILAHSDFTQISPKARNLVDEVNARYNNDYFHFALQLEPGQVYFQNFPYPDSAPRSQTSFVLEYILPEHYNYSADFATPVAFKGKNFATVHVVMNRIHLYNLLEVMLKKFYLVLGLSALAATFVWALLLLAFYFRTRYIQNLWRDMLRHHLENAVLRTGIREDLTALHEKLNQLEKKASVVPPRQIRSAPEPIDAILLE